MMQARCKCRPRSTSTRTHCWKMRGFPRWLLLSSEKGKHLFSVAASGIKYCRCLCWCSRLFSFPLYVNPQCQERGTLPHRKDLQSGGCHGSSLLSSCGLMLIPSVYRQDGVITYDSNSMLNAKYRGAGSLYPGLSMNAGLTSCPVGNWLLTTANCVFLDIRIWQQGSGTFLSF